MNDIVLIFESVCVLVGEKWHTKSSDCVFVCFGIAALARPEVPKQQRRSETDDGHSVPALFRA